MRVNLPPKHYIENCPGQACAERAECLRFMRPAQFPRVDRTSGAAILQRWASFDVERARFGSCAAKLEPHHGGAMAHALLKAA